jgi:hypothetical protein
LATFTPLEAHILTGVSQATQRDWRRREVLGAKKGTKGWNRFTTQEIASLLIMNKLIPDIRPGGAWWFSRQASGVVDILAHRAYGPSCRIDGEKLRPIQRFHVRAGFGRGSSRSFPLDDLSNLTKAAREGDDPNPSIHVLEKGGGFRTVRLKQGLVTHYLVVDLFDFADELEARQVKPYFVEVNRPSSMTMD